MTQDYLLLGLLLLVAVWVARDAWGDMISRALNDPENGQALFAPLARGLGQAADCT